jgi:hypothetical protein
MMFEDLKHARERIKELEEKAKKDEKNSKS